MDVIAKAGSESKLGEQCEVSAELVCGLCGGLMMSLLPLMYVRSPRLAVQGHACVCLWFQPLTSHDCSKLHATIV